MSTFLGDDPLTQYPLIKTMPTTRLASTSSSSSSSSSSELQFSSDEKYGSRKNVVSLNKDASGRASELSTTSSTPTSKVQRRGSKEKDSKSRRSTESLISGVDDVDYDQLPIDSSEFEDDDVDHKDDANVDVSETAEAIHQIDLEDGTTDKNIDKGKIDKR